MLDQGMYNATLGNSCINWMVSLNSTYFMVQIFVIFEDWNSAKELEILSSCFDVISMEIYVGCVEFASCFGLEVKV